MTAGTDADLCYRPTAKACLRFVFLDLNALQHRRNGGAMRQSRPARQVIKPGWRFTCQEFVEAVVQPLLQQSFYDVTLTAQPPSWWCSRTSSAHRRRRLPQ
jgi:hypothetical protein